MFDNFDMSCKALPDKTLSMLIILVSAILAFFGLVVVFQASMTMYDKPMDAFLKQSAAMALSWILMLLMVKYLPSIKNYKGVSVWFFIITGMGLLTAALLSPAINGVHRWISIGGIPFQSSEYAKLCLIFVWAYYLSKGQDKISEMCRYAQRKKSAAEEYLGLVFKFFEKFKLPIIITLIYFVLINGGSDLGTIVVLSFTVFAMLLMTKIPKSFLVITMLVIVALISVYLIYVYNMSEDEISGKRQSGNYRTPRIYAFLHSDYDLEDLNEQNAGALYSISEGSVCGVGLSDSMGQNYVPEANCDFIYSVISESFGFVGGAVIAFFYGVLAFLGFIISHRIKDQLFSYCCFGLILEISLQAILNMSVVLRLVPNKGIALPFISNGGSSLLISFLYIGMILYFFKNNKNSAEELPKKIIVRNRFSNNAAVTIDSSSNEYRQVSAEKSLESIRAVGEMTGKIKDCSCSVKPVIKI